MTTKPDSWQPISTAPEGVEVLTLSPGGQEQRLTRRGRLWWTGGGSSMYIYYTPTHWRKL